MYFFAATQQSSIAKLPALFYRFQTEECLLRVNKSKLLDKTILMEIIVRLKVNMIQLTTDKNCFGHFGGFVTHGVTLRLPSK